MDSTAVDSDQNISFENGLLYINNFYQQSSIDEIEFSYSIEPSLKSPSMYMFLSPEENQEVENILQVLDEAIQINIEPNENLYKDECEEIISILKKPIPKKIHHKKHHEKNLFKCFKTPKKISLVGRVLSDIPSNEIQTNLD